jgi:hypothetical protein
MVLQRAAASISAIRRTFFSWRYCTWSEAGARGSLLGMGREHCRHGNYARLGAESQLWHNVQSLPTSTGSAVKGCTPELAL